MRSQSVWLYRAIWRTERDCSEHAQGMFLVLADARIARCRNAAATDPRAQNRMLPILSNKASFTALYRPLKKPRTSRGGGKEKEHQLYTPVRISLVPI